MDNVYDPYMLLSFMIFIKQLINQNSIRLTLHSYVFLNIVQLL